MDDLTRDMVEGICPICRCDCQGRDDIERWERCGSGCRCLACDCVTETSPIG